MFIIIRFLFIAKNDLLGDDSVKQDCISGKIQRGTQKSINDAPVKFAHGCLRT